MVAGASLAIVTCATAGPIVTSTVAVLLAGTGSSTVDDTVPALVSTVPSVSVGSGRTVTVTVTVPPAGTVPSGQLTAAVHVAPAEPTKVTPAGRVSDRTVPAAFDGPLFVTVTV